MNHTATYKGKTITINRARMLVVGDQVFETLDEATEYIDSL